MKQRKVVDVDNLPMRMPLVLTAVVWLLLDRFQAPGWVMGAAGVFVGLVWVVWVVDTLNRVNVDIFNKDSWK